MSKVYFLKRLNIVLIASNVEKRGTVQSVESHKTDRLKPEQMSTTMSHKTHNVTNKKRVALSHLSPLFIPSQLKMKQKVQL